MAPSKQLRFEPPENPANATGQFLLCGQSFRTASKAAPNIASRHGVESCCALIVASEARIIQPSASAGGRYASASIGLVVWKAVVDLTIRIGRCTAGSKPGGSLRTAPPV